jgi:hypothetical protein
LDVAHDNRAGVAVLHRHTKPVTNRGRHHVRLNPSAPKTWTCSWRIPPAGPPDDQRGMSVTLAVYDRHFPATWAAAA